MSDKVTLGGDPAAERRAREAEKRALLEEMEEQLDRNVKRALQSGKLRKEDHDRTWDGRSFKSQADFEEAKWKGR